MPEEKMYVLDTDVFLQAKRQYYCFKIVPGFWRALAIAGENGKVCSIDKVKAEIERGKESDELHSWVKARKNFFKSSDSPEVNKWLQEAINWVEAQDRYERFAKDKFAGEIADPWVIAFAKANGFVLVTMEKEEPESKAVVKIPDVCRALEVPHISTFELLAFLEIQLDLKET